MIFITAANSHYFNGLMNLVGSIHFWSPDRKIVIFNLGLTYRQIKEINKWNNAALVNNWLSSDLPEHCRVIHIYAWKPVIINHAIKQHSSILWIDAGSDIRAPVAEIQNHIDQDGHFFVQGQDTDMTLMSHDNCYRSMGTRKALFQRKEHFAGNLQGYKRRSQAHNMILDPLYLCALNPECIAPEGSDLSNHRFDQTLLSILIYQSGLSVQPHTYLLAAHRHQLNVDPKKQSDAIVYTARCSSQEYVCWIRDRSNKLLYE